MNRYAVLILLPLMITGCAAQHEGRPSVALPAEAMEQLEESRDTAHRKIIYTGTLALVVEDLLETDKKLTALLPKHEAYLSTYNEDRNHGGRPAGTWVIRLPADQFQSLIDAVMEFGVVTARQIESEDVTEQYLDLNARLKNQKVLEERVLHLLEERTGEIKDVLEVESQLGRIREEVEKLEGKLRFLSDRVAMTTVTITAREDRTYVPQQPRTLAAKASSTFWRSLQAMGLVIEAIVLATVALLPWFLVGLLVLSPVVILVRRYARRISSRPASTATVPG